jgi:hypothetical protein
MAVRLASLQGCHARCLVAAFYLGCLSEFWQFPEPTQSMKLSRLMKDLLNRRDAEDTEEERGEKIKADKILFTLRKIFIYICVYLWTSVVKIKVSASHN